MTCARLVSHRGLCLCLALTLLALAGCEDHNAKVKAEYDKLQKEIALVQPNKNPRVEIKLNNPDVTLVVELLEDTYPAAVNRFIALLNDGYYNDRMVVNVPAEDDRNKIGIHSHIQFTLLSNVSKSGFNGVYLADATPAGGVAISHLSEGKLSVPKVADPRIYGLLITREADPALDATCLPIGVVIAGNDKLASIGMQTVIQEYKIARLSREAAQYALSKNELPVPVTVSKPAPRIIDNTEQPQVLITTEKGPIKVELNEDAAPNTVGNFMHLALRDFYDNGVFHRVEDWVVQGGDPKGNGSGGPGYNFANEINWESLGLSAEQQASLTQQGFKSTPGLKSLHHGNGVIAMAHAGPGTNGSQFYFVRNNKDASFLDGKHTVFGKVLEGMELINGFANGRPVRILSVTVLSRRAHKYVDGAHGPSTDPDPTAVTVPATPAPTIVPVNPTPGPASSQP